MCDVLDKVESRGVAKGIVQGMEKGMAKGESRGETKMALLMGWLFDQNRIDDAKRASKDEDYRAKLLKELGIH